MGFYSSIVQRMLPVHFQFYISETSYRTVSSTQSLLYFKQIEWIFLSARESRKEIEKKQEKKCAECVVVQELKF